MILKDMFLNMNYDTNEKYREIFAETEEKIDEQSDVYLMSDFSRYLIGCVDINQLIEKRRKNSQRLLMGLEEIGVSSARGFKRNECPLVVPVRVRNRDEFRKYLIDNRIYCAVHWPFDGFKAHERKHAVDNAESLISLPVDQRYGDEEIDYMIDVIRRYGGGLSY